MVFGDYGITPTVCMRGGEGTCVAESFGEHDYWRYNRLKVETGNRREGEGVRVHWDRQREPSFTSRWNPFATDMPFITFIQHPVNALCSTYNSLCDIAAFRDLVQEVAQKANSAKPVPGRANGVLLLNQPVHIDVMVGAMANFGNGNKLGYSMARGNLGF